MRERTLLVRVAWCPQGEWHCAATRVRGVGSRSRSYKGDNGTYASQYARSLGTFLRAERLHAIRAAFRKEAMIPYFYAVDDFFPPYEFEIIRDYAHIAKYEDRVAPFDGVTYRNIGIPLPAFEQRIAESLSWMMGYKVVPKFCAFRLSLEGSEPPQWVHSDREVSKFGMFMFINPGPGGTILVEHLENGMRTHPRDENELAIWKRDYEDESKWRVRAAIDCAPNRAIILRSELLHAAIPRRGFGDDVTNGRLIMLCFFD
jgi:hypothetical protein